MLTKDNKVSIEGLRPTPQSCSIISSTTSLPITKLSKATMRKIQPIPSETDSLENMKIGRRVKFYDTLKQPASLQSPWHIVCVKEIPSHFLLEKTHCIVKGLTPEYIAENIVECLSSLSIAADYDDDNAEAIAETLDNVCFYVRLFREKTEQKGKKDGIIVETQRRIGSCITYHHISRLILKAAGGHAWKNETTDSSCNNMSLQIRPEIAQRSLLHKTEENISSSLRVNVTLLCNNRYDANMLGMENLRYLTDVNHTEANVAAAAARQVLYCSRRESLHDVEDSKIHTFIKSLLKTWRMESYEKQDAIDYESEHSAKMHYYALCILANSLSLMSTLGELLKIVNRDSWFKNELVSLLLHELKCTEGRSQNSSFQAARSLNVLVNASNSLKEEAVHLGVFPLLDKLRSSGRCGHALLSKELDSTEHQLKN